jgi:glycosyltransferase involved in cell wall biosynthesis
MAADIFVLLSRDDPFPCVVHEAMAASLPIVAFDRAGGTPEALTEDCGLVVPYLDVQAMAERVCELLRSPGRIEEIGKKAEDRVRKLYRFETFADRIIGMAMAAVAERPRSARG